MRNLTLSIGIPAHNEEQSIPLLLESILRQRCNSFVLSEVIVIIDGSTDKTYDAVKKFSQHDKRITIINRKRRAGKADALNLIYTRASSAYLLTIDADLYFESDLALEKMIQRLKKNSRLNLTSVRHKPIMPKSFMGKFAAYSHLILEDVFLKINNGNNFYSVMGMEMMPKRFYKSFQLPKYTLSDQCYVYAKATSENRYAFSLVNDEFAYFMPVQTFYDWRILSVRSVKGDKEDVVKHFGKGILSSYSMSKTMYFRSTLKFFIKSPINTIGAILMNIFIRLFPYKKLVVKKGMWQMTRSSKVLSGI